MQSFHSQDNTVPFSYGNNNSEYFNTPFYNNYNSQQNTWDENRSYVVDQTSSNDGLTPLDDNTRFNFSPQRSQMISKKIASEVNSSFKNQNVNNFSNQNPYSTLPFYGNHVTYNNNNNNNNSYVNPSYANSSFSNTSYVNNSIVYDNSFQNTRQPIIANTNNQINNNDNILLKQQGYNKPKNQQIENCNQNDKMANKFKPNKKHPMLPPKRENESIQNKTHNHYENNYNSTKKSKQKKMYSNRNTANYNSNYIVKQSAISNTHNVEHDDGSSASPVTVLTTISTHHNNQNNIIYEERSNTNSSGGNSCCNSSHSSLHDVRTNNSETENQNPIKSKGGKKQPCQEWNNVGICIKGDKCPFSHVVSVTDTRVHVTNYKTKPCVDPGRGFQCQYYEKCNFVHPGEPLRRPMPIEHNDEQYYMYLLRDCPTNYYPFGIFV